MIHAYILQHATEMWKKKLNYYSYSQRISTEKC